ncbi:MAG: hypothetical protein EBV36_07385 [Burkholderiaceae bacterium]|nr:hypothetical protein [Burkholderiaceae bacterium]
MGPSFTKVLVTSGNFPLGPNKLVTHFESKGALLFERLQTGPGGSHVASELKDTDVLTSGMEFRINLCDRGFRLIKIGEAKL